MGDAAGLGLQCTAAVIGGLAVLSVVLAVTTRGSPSPALWVSRRERKRIGRWLLRIPVPTRFARRLDRPELATALRHSSLGLDRHQFIALQWAALLGGCLCLAALLVLRPVDPLSGLLVTLVFAAGAFGPRLWLKLHVQRRQMEILSLPDLHILLKPGRLTDEEYCEEGRGVHFDPKLLDAFAVIAPGLH